MTKIERRQVIAGAAAALAAGPALAQQPVVTPAPALPTFNTMGRAVRINMQTSEGLIGIDLYVEKAPITASNYLNLVDQKRFDNSTLYRAMRAPGAPESGVVQGGILYDPKRPVKGIAHEPTTQTGIKHKDGTISMGRNEPGSAASDFFFCVGEASYLDANPAAPGDNLGYPAFGQVVEGMDIVRRILAMPTDGKAPNPAMQGQWLTQAVKIISARRA